jgi:hypothetical protein
MRVELSLDHADRLTRSPDPSLGTPALIGRALRRQIRSAGCTPSGATFSIAGTAANLTQSHLGFIPLIEQNPD